MRTSRSRPEAALLAILASMSWILVPGAALSATPEKIFAQKLLEETLSKHTEVTGLEIAATTKHGCKTIAATDPKELEEKCDAEVWRPLRSGKPYVEREKDGFDVTLPLHDASGKTIAVVGMDFKPEPAQTKESVIEQGRQITGEMEKQVPSKAKLFERAE